MLRLSMNLLSNILLLLTHIKEDDICAILDDASVPYRLFSVSEDSMLELAEKCKWLTQNDNWYCLSDHGKQLINKYKNGSTERAFRIMLSDYIAEIKPIWRSRIPYGRKEATLFMKKDEIACFVEAGLLTTNLTKDVIEWWDNQASLIREESNEELMSSGRQGELLTLEYEKKRTGVIPDWKSIESNLLGYDIQSQKSKTDHSHIFIEVKASTNNVDSAFFYVSHHEWDVAKNNADYLFYIWSVEGKTNKLAILKPYDVSFYIPIDQREGKWESVRIPFSSIANRFSVV